MENAVAVLTTSLPPFLVDPSSTATEWIKAHLKQARLEIVNQHVRKMSLSLKPSLTIAQDANFTTALELAVRFGKTLVIQEMGSIEPVLFPIIRKDLIAQGPRFCVQVGDKASDMVLMLVYMLI